MVFLENNAQLYSTCFIQEIHSVKYNVLPKTKTEDSFGMWQVECIMKLYLTKQATLDKKM